MIELVRLGLGAQVFRGVIPLIAMNGKISSVSEVPKKEALYAIKVAMTSIKGMVPSQDPIVFGE